jgi:hypothetical protein
LEKIERLEPNKDVLSFLHGFGFGKPATSFKTWNSESAINFQQEKAHYGHTKRSLHKTRKYDPMKARSQNKKAKENTSVPAITSNQKSNLNISHRSDNLRINLTKYNPMKKRSQKKDTMKTTSNPAINENQSSHLNISHASNNLTTIQHLCDDATNIYGINFPESQDAAHSIYHHYFASQQPIASAISIIDVRGDGHCGYYTLMLGLAHLNLFPSGITNVNDFRSNFVHQITQIPRNTLLQSLQPCFPSFANNTLHEEVQSASARIGEGSSWMDAYTDLPLASLIFRVRITLFDITMPPTMPGKFSYIYHEGPPSEITSEIVQGCNLTQSDISLTLPTILIVRTPAHFMWICRAT